MPVLHIHRCRTHLFALARDRKQCRVDHLHKGDWPSACCVGCLDGATRRPQLGKADTNAARPFGNPHRIAHALSNRLHIILHFHDEAVAQLWKRPASIDAGATARAVFEISHVLVKLNGCLSRVFLIVAQTHGDTHSSKLRHFKRVAILLAQGIAVAVGHHAKIFTQSVFTRVKRSGEALEVKDRLILHARVKQTVGHCLANIAREGLPMALAQLFISGIYAKQIAVDRAQQQARRNRVVVWVILNILHRRLDECLLQLLGRHPIKERQLQLTGNLHNLLQRISHPLACRQQRGIYLGCVEWLGRAIALGNMNRHHPSPWAPYYTVHKTSHQGTPGAKLYCLSLPCLCVLAIYVASVSYYRRQMWCLARGFVKTTTDFANDLCR